MNSLHLAYRSLVLLVALLAVACAGQADTAPRPEADAGEVVNAAVDVPRQQATAVDTMGTPDAAALSLPLNDAGEPLVARVNEAEIRLVDLERALARFEMQQIPGMDASAQRTNVLNSLIEQALISEAAAAQNVQVTDDDVQAELDANVELAGSEAAWNEWLAQNLYTAEEFRQTLADTLLTARMRDQVTQDLSGSVPHVHARHILVATELQADEVVARLNSGEDFGTLAAAYSSDVTTREQGGDLGWFAKGELLEPYLEEVVFALEPGEVAGPVATSLGYHVVQVIERDERPVPEEKWAIVAQGQFELWLDNLRSAATIEIYE